MSIVVIHQIQAYRFRNRNTGVW